MGSHSLLKGIFPTQGLDPDLPLQADSLPSEPPGNLKDKKFLLTSTDHFGFLTLTSEFESSVADMPNLFLNWQKVKPFLPAFSGHSNDNGAFGISSEF